MADRNQEGLNNIITAINNIVEPKISNSKFDRTFRAKVIEKTENEDYIVQINNINYTLKYAGKLEPNQIVRVKAPLNNFSDIYIEPLPGSGGGGGGTNNYDDLVNKPILETDISEKLVPDKSELIKGTIKLHKISKTGSYNDLNDSPKIPTKISELENDSGFTSNTGTVTQVSVKMNENIKGTVTSSGTIDLGNVQEQLVSGSNIKTINNQSLLGSGNINIEGTITNAITNVSVPGQTTTLTRNDGSESKVLSIDVSSNSGEDLHWLKIGTFEDTTQGGGGEIWLVGGAGQNSETYQNMWIHLLIKKGYQASPSTTKHMAGTYEIFSPINAWNYQNVKIKLFCKEINKVDVWVYFPYTYSRSFFYPAGYYDSFTLANILQKEEPVSGDVYGVEQPCEGQIIKGSKVGYSVDDAIGQVSVSTTAPTTSDIPKLWVNTSNSDLLYNNSSSGGWQSLLSSVFAYNNPDLKMSKSNVIYFTPQVGESWSGWGGCFYYKRGTTVTVHIAVKLGTSNRVRVFNLPVGYRPPATIPAWGGGADGGVPDSSFCETYDSGDIMVKSNSQYALILYSFDVFA